MAEACRGDGWLWIGPRLGRDGLDAESAISLAAARWQRGLLAGLAAVGPTPLPVTYVPHRLWPNGKARIREGAASLEPLERTVGYWNVPVLRERSIAHELTLAATDLLRGWGLPRVVVTYNVGRRVVSAALTMRARLGVPWIAIVADVADGVEKRRQMEAMASADGCVYLSWEAFLGAPGENKLHLDGGVDRLPAGDEGFSEPGLIVYSGALNEFGGLPLLLEAMRDSRLSGCRLVLTGRNPPAALCRVSRVGDRIEFAGTLSEEDLERLSKRAAVFVNPRPPEATASVWNFPSKVLEYLSYGKPTVSTWSPGLAPEYRDVLVVAREGSASEVARSVMLALRMSNEERAILRGRICSFLAEGRTWERQAARLADWVSGLWPTVRRHGR